ncbi:sensor histidine kinase [Arundinibacter roseus]|uniref:histidine kinase n=1 Tax=Arundinibacter roseus TaxID=2070510 RepID=A0A4R4KKU4_9BACT|nr:ATP-binding protein [Arundinibacter roseus]TDB68914.1 HAMP domain-containing protein [Arundinibacter roseus]
MKIKTKLTLGVGLLFILIVLLGGVGTRYIQALKSDAENILKANYNSLEYSRNMLLSLENSKDRSLMGFDSNLIRQENNLTEIREKEVTRQVREAFVRLQKNRNDSLAKVTLRAGLFKIMEMNMQAIQQKSELAGERAEKAVFWIALTATLCFFTAFVLLINLPSQIADPIRELSQSIQQIAAGNYHERLHFESHDEFGELAQSFNTMAEKLEEYKDSNVARLHMEKKRIETLISNMSDPVIGLDESLKVIFANDKALDILGLSSSELLGHQTRELALRNDLVRRLIEDLLTSAEQSSDAASESIKIYANHQESYFEKDTHPISIVPPGETATRLIGHVIILRNVTAYKELDFAKTSFIATVSHEFKTPISSVKMSVQLLENEQIGPLNSEQRNLLSGIRQDADRLLKITSELLNITQIESGNIKIIPTSTDAGVLVADAVQAVKTQAAQKRITFEFSIPDELPYAEVDVEKTTWVLTNLLSNAIRYSYDGSVIYVSLVYIKGFIQIAVKDTGQGIAPQYIDKLFNRYFRVPGSKKEGTGLGLAISKEFIEAQGGQILVETDFGTGSTFTITLPAIA